jgi:hypothetical protein
VKLSQNRQASILYLLLSATPIAILVVLFEFSTPAELWASRSITWIPVGLVAVACADLALAMACFPDRTRQRSRWLVLLMATLTLAIALGCLRWWVPALFHLLPAWLLWRRYGESSGQPQAA